LKGSVLASFSIAVGVEAQAAAGLSDLERQVLEGAEAPPSSSSSSAYPETVDTAPTSSASDSFPSGEGQSAPESASASSSASFEAPKGSEGPERPDYELRAIEQAIRGPREIPLEHILVVQNRYIRKAERHELSPLMVGLQLADSFRRQMQFGFSYVYHLDENWGFEALHGMLIKNYGTGLNQAVRTSTSRGNATGLETDRLESVMSLGAAVQWTPFTSKAGTDDRIYYFEGYFLLGGGAVVYENATYGMLMYGLGFRSYVTRTAILKAELRNYADFRGGISDRLNVLAGASLLLGGPSK